MRSIIAGGSLVVLMFAAGCNLISPHSPYGGTRPAPSAANATPTVENLVEYLNKNAARIQTTQAINCGNITIDINADGTKVGVSGKMLCQTPRNFLLSGVVLGRPVVDIGSNNKEFWFWSSEMKTRENPTAYLYHCSYDDLDRGTKVPFPFQPDMVVSALGLAKYDLHRKYDLKIAEEGKGHKVILLTEQAVSPENKPIQKITKFDFQIANVPHPQVLAHILKDEKGNVICAATIRSAQYVGGETGPIIPRIIDFSWPEQKLKMTMRIENPSITSMPSEKAATIFTRQNLTYPSFNLATRTPDGGVERAGATAPIYRR